MESNTGNVTVHIVAFQTGDPRYQLASGKGNKGLSIAQLRKNLGETKERYLIHTMDICITSL